MVAFTVRKSALQCVTSRPLVADVSLPDLPDSKSSLFPWKMGLTLYGVSFLPGILPMNEFFWDVWTWFNHQTPKLLKVNCTRSGNAPWRTWIEVYLLQSSLPIFRIVTIIDYFAVGYLLFQLTRP